MKGITPEQYQRIGELYYAALELAPEARPHFLTVECGKDEVLRREVESLIAAREQADGFVAGKVAGLVAEMADRQERQSQVGQNISHYQVLSLLGAGGMGEVYLAQDSLLERKVALKLLPSAFTNNQERLRRFKKEARSVSSLNHPNILTIFDVGVDRDIHFIATEFIDGQSLRERLSGRPLELGEALDFAIQIASALTAAHEAGIIHRDIKPENVMLRRDGIIKVLDFGLAKLTEPKEGAEVGEETPTLVKVTTAAGMVLGTPQYMSPEQARGEKVDARTDIFSFGVLIYEMIAGRPPFESPKPMDVIASILKEEPVPLGKGHPGTPPELETIVGKALRKNRDERYETAKDLLADLKELKRRLEFQAELERSAQPDLPSGKTVKYRTAENPAPRTGEINYQTALSGAIQTGESPAKAKTTSIQFEIPRRAMLVGVIAVALAVVTATLIYLLRPKPILTDKDTILLTEFENKTGEAVFDGTLRQGLAVQLQQSPFLDIFPDARVRSTLRLMSRSPDDRVTRESGREICQRQGLKALIAGSIAKFDHNYSITLEALNGQTGDSLALTQVEAEGKDQVLKALSRAATELRGKLGESLSSIQ
jgi:serine/threonine protein kinase